MKQIIKCLLWSVVLVLSASSCSDDGKTPSTPPAKQMTLSVSSLTLELYKSATFTVNNAPSTISVQAPDGVTAVVADRVVSLTLAKPLTEEVAVVVTSGEQQAVLKLRMSAPRAIAAPYGVFSGENSVLKIAYASKKLNAQTEQLEYFVLSSHKTQPLTQALRVEAPSISNGEASFNVKAYGSNIVSTDNVTLFEAGKTYALKGSVLLSTDEKVQVRVVLSPSGAILDFVIPKQ